MTKHCVGAMNLRLQNVKITIFSNGMQCVYWGMLTKCLPNAIICGLVYSTFKFVMLAIFVVE